MKELISVLQAADAAARWHADQRRKGAAQEPYINHLIEVACLVTQATDGTEPNVVIAALLHDTVEDAGVIWGARRRYRPGSHGRQVAAEG